MNELKAKLRWPWKWILAYIQQKYKRWRNNCESHQYTHDSKFKISLSHCQSDKSNRCLWCVLLKQSTIHVRLVYDGKPFITWTFIYTDSNSRVQRVVLQWVRSRGLWLSVGHRAMSPVHCTSGQPTTAALLVDSTMSLWLLWWPPTEYTMCINLQMVCPYSCMMFIIFSWG